MWAVDFTSDSFLPILPEEAQVNPGAYGFELSLWLAQELARRGVVTSYPGEYEDIGWQILESDGDVETTFICTSLADAGEGYLQRPVRWRIAIEAIRPGSLLRRTVAADTASRAGLVEAVLRDAGIAFERVPDEGD